MKKPLQEKGGRVTGEEGRGDESLRRPGIGTQALLGQSLTSSSGPQDGLTQDEQAGGGQTAVATERQGRTSRRRGGIYFCGQDVREAGERREVWAVAGVRAMYIQRIQASIVLHCTIRLHL